MIITIVDTVFGVEYDINIKFLVSFEGKHAKEKIWKGTCTISNIRKTVNKTKKGCRVKKGKIKIKKMKNLKSNLQWKEYKKKRNKIKVLVWLPNGYRKSYTGKINLKP